MNWLSKTRPVLIVIGLGLAIGSLVGARALTHHGSGEEPAKVAPAPHPAGGPIVLGTVDSDPQMVSYGLPPVLQSGTVKEVFVKERASVKAGQKLYSFDTTIQRADVELARAAVAYTETKVKQAEELARQHAATVDFTRDTVLKSAERKVNLTRAYYNLVKDGLIKNYQLEKISEAEWPKKLELEPNLYKANVEYDTAMGEFDGVQAKLKQLQAADPQVNVKEAQAAVAQARAQLAKAQDVVDLCVIRAQTDGTVVQMSISHGTTLGISTRTPALWLIPAGARVVRAEVEAEFAHRVGPNLIGKTVTIQDHSDPKLTYSGTVRDIGDAFLRKRASAENLLGSDTLVLEAVIDVTDPAPAGKPPLRIGQRVRVNLGQ